MKNLPETKFWNDLKSRLMNYSETPEDDFDLIISKIPKQEPRWLDHTGHALTIISLMTFLFLVNPAGDSRLASAVTNLSERDVRNSTGTVDTTNVPHLQGTGGTKESINYLEEKYGQEQLGSSEISDNKTNRMELSAMQNRGGKNVLPVRSSNGRSGEFQVGMTSEEGDAIIKSEDETEMPGSTAEGSLPEKGYPANKGTFPTDAASLKRDSAAVADKEPTTKSAVSETIIPGKKRRSFFKPTVYFSVTPSLSYFKLIPDRNDDVVITNVEKDGILSMKRMGFQVDAGFEYQLSRKLQFLAGLSYFSHDQSITYHHLAGVENIESTSRMNYTLIPSTATRNFNFHEKSAGLNATFFYLIKNSKLSHRIGAGVQFNKAFMKYSVETLSFRSTANHFNYQLLYRLQYSVSENMDWYIQPSYLHSLTSRKLSNESFTLKPHRAGIGIGVIWRF
jgi:hypothetical protein